MKLRALCMIGLLAIVASFAAAQIPATDDAYTAMDKEVRKETYDSVKFADESPWPTEASITEDVYFEVDRQTQAGRTGRHFFNS